MFHPPTILYTMSYDTGLFIILFMYGIYPHIWRTFTSFVFGEVFSLEPPTAR